MKQPNKPKWKRWLLTGVATLGIAGFGSGMMINTPVVPQNNVAPTQSTTVYLEVTDTFNAQANNSYQLSLAQDATDAAILDDMTALQRTLRNGYDLHADDESVLRTAVTFESYDVAKYVLHNGGDVNAKNGGALEQAVIIGKLGMVQLLVENGADVNIDNAGPLFWAVLSGQHDTVQYLIDHGAIVTSGTLEIHTATTDKTMSDILNQGIAKQAGKDGRFLGIPYSLPDLEV